MTLPGIANAPGSGSPRVLVIVGTDHHPFDRLIRWVNGWLDQHPDQVGEFFVQWGAAAARPVCAGAQFLTSDQLSSLLGGAGAVVCHGGGGSISDARARGITPIVVTRRRRLGEHVDDHQVHFSTRLSELGYIRLARTLAEFTSLLDDASHDQRPPPGHQRAPIGSQDADVAAAVARFGAFVDELVTMPRHRRFAAVRRLGRGQGADIGAPGGSASPGVALSAGVSPATSPQTYVDLAGAPNKGERE